MTEIELKAWVDKNLPLHRLKITKGSNYKVFTLVTLHGNRICLGYTIKEAYNLLKDSVDNKLTIGETMLKSIK